MNKWKALDEIRSYSAKEEEIRLAKGSHDMPELQRIRSYASAVTAFEKLILHSDATERTAKIILRDLLIGGDRSYSASEVKKMIQRIVRI